MVKLRQYIANHKVGIFIIVIVLVLVSLAFAFSVRRYGWPRTGFFYYTTPKSDTEEFHPSKTLWDWMELLIIPLVLVVGAFLLRAQRQQELDIAAEERETGRQIAKYREEERALQSYLEAMTELLLEKKLRTSEEGSEVRSIAHARTLTILRSLSGERKGSILRFLYEAELIHSEEPVIALGGADLREANLEGARLRDANLVEANLVRANLRKADLERAHLWGAYLVGADLGSAKLVWADLVGAHLTGAKLWGAKLWVADLRDANLVEANLVGADLGSAKLVWADLRGAYLEGADLVGVNLRKANLEGANLRGAHLSLAELRGANLKRACLEGAELELTILPDGTKWTQDTDIARFTDPDHPDFWQRDA